jgi:hypothetical protein
LAIVRGCFAPRFRLKEPVGGRIHFLQEKDGSQEDLLLLWAEPPREAQLA